MKENGSVAIIVVAVILLVEAAVLIGNYKNSGRDHSDMREPHDINLYKEDK